MKIALFLSYTAPYPAELELDKQDAEQALKYADKIVNCVNDVLVLSIVENSENVTEE